MKHLGAIEGGGTWFRAATGRADGTLLETLTIPTTTPDQLFCIVKDVIPTVSKLDKHMAAYLQQQRVIANDGYGDPPECLTSPSQPLPLITGACT